MKRYFFLCGYLLASSCSDEIIESGGTDMPAEQSGKCMITISLPMSNTRSGDVADDEHYNVAGKCVVDKGSLLVFESEKQFSEEHSKAEYKFTKSVELTFANETYNKEEYIFDGKRYTAAADFTPEKGKYYRLYAYAYNSKGVVPTFDLDNKELQNLDTETVADRLASITMPRPESVPTFDENVTREIFGGFVEAFDGDEPYPKDNSHAALDPQKSYQLTGSVTSGIIVGDDVEEYTSYGADIRRQTGRLDITLSEMGKNNVTKATLWIERYTNKTPAGMELTSRGEGDEAIYFYHNPFLQERNEVAVATATPDSEGAVRLCADMLRTESSYVYVELEYTDSHKSRYAVRCADQTVAAGPDAVETQIAKDNKITVPENFWILLEGDYDNLVRNNLKIKVDWEEDINGPDLNEQ